MHGFKRIFVFCLVTTFLPAVLIILPLWLRHSKFADVHYKVAESDILEIRHGISSVFCQRHSLRMNTTFNAFQLNKKPKVSEIRKHIRLRKSMILPDDTLEYWGFYLLKGATVNLKVCSRYDGSRILVVKGDKDLKTCGLLEHNKNKYGTNSDLGNVIVTFETNAEIVINGTTHGYDVNPGGDVEEEEDDGLGLHFDVPKIKKKKGEEDENNASEREDFDIALLGTTTKKPVHHHHHHHQSQHNQHTTTTTTTKKTVTFEGVEFTTIRQSKEATTDLSKNDSKQKSKESLENNTEDSNKTVEKATLRPVDELPTDTESWTEYVKAHKEKIREKQKQVSAEKDKESVTKADDDEEDMTESFAKALQSLEDDDDTPLTEREKKKLENVLRKLSQRKLRRTKRDKVLERGVSHGGTALNYTDDKSKSNSVSSFENNLFNCYANQILFAQDFHSTTLCRDVKYLEQGPHMVATHEVASDGYYYYIFYSDNDNVKNDINALFDIHKPTFLYANISETSKCYNSTSCSFDIEFLTDEVVIVEVPTRDGIEHEGDDFTVLISTCHPRMGIYVIFPIAVLFLILTCAFL